MDSAKDPMLWAVDYCALGRSKKVESASQDDRSYKLIKSKIVSEFDLWATGQQHYY